MRRLGVISAILVVTVFVTVDGISDPPYQNPTNRYDVNGDGYVSPSDLLILINYLNVNGSGPVPDEDTGDHAHRPELPLCGPFRHAGSLL